MTGDLSRRLCTVADIKFYFSSFYDDSGEQNYLRPNKNCNLTSWLSGCEPGWSCSVDEGDKVNLKDSNSIPTRNVNCGPCCEGFFCPRGITCMMREYLEFLFLFRYMFTWRSFWSLSSNSSTTYTYFVIWLISLDKCLSYTSIGKPNLGNNRKDKK